MLSCQFKKDEMEEKSLNVELNRNPPREHRCVCGLQVSVEEEKVHGISRASPDVYYMFRQNVS